MEAISTFLHQALELGKKPTDHFFVSVEKIHREVGIRQEFPLFYTKLMKPVFLTAEWLNPLLANYLVEPSLLKKYLPAGTELDFWNDRCYVSLVGFRFLKTKVLGVAIPFHQDFEEVNLRFYMRFKDGKEWKRGVVFIKEIVPKAAITFFANHLYGENYQTLPMRHVLEKSENGSWSVAYGWRVAGDWNWLKAKTGSQSAAFLPGSEEEFITEHYWGYTKWNDRKTSEYQVEHPAWRVYPVLEHQILVNGEWLYGKPFGEILNRKPDSIFMAEGSEVAVRMGRNIL